MELNKVMPINNYALLLKYVSLGLGVTILNAFTLLDQGETFSVHELVDTLPSRAYGIATKKDKHLAPQVKAFINHLKKSDLPDNVSGTLA